MATAITISPTTVARGPSPGAIGVTGSGFASFERVTILAGLLAGAVVSADVNGNIVAAIPNPGTVYGIAATVQVAALSVNGTAFSPLTIT